MAVREIKTKLTIDSEKQFNREIKEAGRNMRVMASEMKAAAADFNLTGNEMDYLTRKSNSLNGQIKQQEAIIKSLEDAVLSSAKAWGETSEQADGYRIKLENAKANLAKLRKELKETDTEMAELGRDSNRVGRQLENGIGEAAEDVSRKFDGMVGSLSADMSSLSKTLNFATGFTVAGTIVEGAKGAYDAITSLVDGSMDYNRQMSFLQVNAEAAGYSFEKIKEYAISVAGITGDMDAAIEGMSMLLKAGFEGEELAKVVERLSGIIVQMPDGMKFENLAESLLESVSTGSAVGQYAEYLSKMGMNIETVNEALEAAKKNGQEAAETAALAMLSGHGAEEVLAKWKTDNADIVDYYTAQSNLTLAQAELARELTPLATDSIELATSLVKSGTELISQAMEFYELLKKPEELVEENEAVKEARESLPGWDNGYVTGAEEAGENDGEEYINGVKKKFIEEAGALPTWDDFAGGYDTGLETGEEFEEGLSAKLEEKEPEIEQAGKDIDTALANGIVENSPVLANAAAGAADVVIAEFGRVASSYAALGQMIGAPPVYGAAGGAASSYAAASGGRWIDNVTLTLDGRELGRTGSNYIGDTLGLQASRQEVYGP